nr:protein kinase-like domain, concanavalin A-like lectin/glucanase domain protein [Tanacetum cinerariifolium]
MHIFVGNFTYVSYFKIVEDISSAIYPRISQVVLEKPFVELSNMTYDLSLRIVKFTNRVDEITYKMPNKIEQFDSLSDIEKEHTQSICFRNEEDKRRGVDYVMNKILRFYKECLELGPEYPIEIKESSSGSSTRNGGVMIEDDEKDLKRKEISVRSANDR